MSELPAGWSHFSLRDVGGLTGGKTPSKATAAFWSSRDVPWVSPKDMKRSRLEDAEDRISQVAVAEAGMTLYPADSVLMVTRSGILQHTFPVALAGTELTVNQDIKVLRPVEGITPRFAFYLLKGFGGKILSVCSKDGTTVQSIDSEKLEAFPLPMPPTAEQTRIVDKLDELLAKVDALKARIDGLPALLKRFRQSVLAAAVSGQLTEDWRAKNVAKIGAEGSAAETQDEFAWPVVRLGDVALDFSYGSSAKSKPAGDIPVLRMGNIQGGRLAWDDLVFSSNPEEIKKYSLQVGDVLFNRTNSPELVGKTATYKGERPAIYAGYLIRVRCSERLAPDFLNHCLNSPQGRDYCWQVKTDGVSQSNINAKKLANFRFGLPSTEEQIEIVRCVDQLFSFAEQLEAKVNEARTRIDRLTQSILAKAFRGELVSQAPEDEPASILLERIRAQRAAVPRSRRGRKALA
ncbi:restriction endonuclease subunit S [Pseudomonas sp. S 311-6]|uniref:restriction endonuclease subunit S n=1 Tax=Pseudomonas TaxID=286 RepID=UPI002098575D|nr:MULTISPECIES: restriction endonuclease subunit S [Pseudomonas]MCO7568117.1 restriction endonuclease subunit S [Pseudomonas mosselii]MCO7619744.1 restriction endonuclease subunit S [Pseudomonas guariconensis]MCO7643519.1 restriction endonuclease subunit S [Pseudomonas sp. S 311-6]